jgi:tetratricopeptide (TPR) repeat protein
MGDYAGSIECQLKHLENAKGRSDRTAEGNALGAIGASYLKLGDLAKAQESFQKQLEIAQETKDRALEGKAYDNLAQAQQGGGDFKKAIGSYTRARILLKASLVGGL